MKVTKKQLRRIIKEEKQKLLEADPYGEAPSRPTTKQYSVNDAEDLNYFQDQIEEAYSRLAAELDDVEELLPEHILAKINEALNNLESVNTAIENFRKGRG